MDVYIARQPIFDRNLRVHGYELLYRRDTHNFFSGIDDNQATSELIYNTFVVMDPQDITGGSLAFINFSKDLIDSDIPFLLPPQKVVIEVLEREEASQATIEACKRLRAGGYTIALDDFIYDDSNKALIDQVDIIKVEYPSVDLSIQQRLIREMRSKTKFLAEKIETREDYNTAVNMGYDYFQGYFFSKPAMLDSKEISSLDINVLRVLEELNCPDPDYKVISLIIERDMGISYKLLKLVNSVYYGARSQIKTIQHALVYVGSNDLYQWFSLMLLKGIQCFENTEMIRLSLVRGKLMELMAEELGYQNKAEYFFTGMFSFIDVLFNKPMDIALSDLPLTDNVKDALMGKDNEHRIILNSIIAYEAGDWEEAERKHHLNKIGVNAFMDIYLKALKWAERLNY